MKEYSGQTSIQLAAPPHVVYEYLLDFTRHPEWSSNLSKVTKITAGEVQVGTRFKTAEGPPPVPPLVKLNMMRGFIKGVLSGAKSYSIAEITALEADRSIAWSAGIPFGDGFFNRADWEFILEPDGEGTHLRQSFRYLPQTSAAEQMVGAAGANGIRQACTVNLQNLKRVVERASHKETSLVPSD